MSDLGLLGGEPVRNTPFPRYPILGDAEVEAVSAAVRTQDLSAEFGATAAAFEREFAKFCGARYAVATSSGTTALHAALAAAGIGVGDEVIVPPYAFLSTATCPSFLTGALPDPLYLDLFVRHAVEAVVEAQERLRPATVAAGCCPAPGWEFNRRLLKPDGRVVMAWIPGVDPTLPAAGPVDREVPFIAFEGEDGAIAVALSYACHNHCVSSEYHSDIAGCAEAALGRALGTEVPLLFYEGACADVMWRGGTPPPVEGGELARRIGGDLVRSLVPAWREAPRQQGVEVAMASEVLEIRDRSWEESTFCHDGCRGDGEEDRRFPRRRYDPEEAAVRQRGETVCPVAVQAIAFGEAVFCAHPAELFVVLGLEIKQRSPFPVPFTASLTNGYCGYVPTEEAFEQQGYETHRTVYTSRLEKGAGRRIVEASVEAMKRVHANCGRDAREGRS